MKGWESKRGVDAKLSWAHLKRGEDGRRRAEEEEEEEEKKKEEEEEKKEEEEEEEEKRSRRETGSAGRTQSHARGCKPGRDAPKPPSTK